MSRKYILWVILILLITGCRSSKPVLPRYYVLEYPLHIEPDFQWNGNTLPLSLEVVPVEVYPAFASYRIALREKTHEIRYFSNFEWAVRPDQGLQNFIIEFLQRNKIFDRVGTRYWNESPDLKFFVRIFQLEVVQERNTFFAHLNLEFQLYQSQTGEMIIHHFSDLRRELPKRNLNMFADEISLIFFDELHLFFEKAGTKLSQVP